MDINTLINNYVSNKKANKNTKQNNTYQLQKITKFFNINNELELKELFYKENYEQNFILLMRNFKIDANLKLGTLKKYTQTFKSFLNWYNQLSQDNKFVFTRKNTIQSPITKNQYILNVFVEDNSLIKHMYTNIYQSSNICFHLHKIDKTIYNNLNNTNSNLILTQISNIGVNIKQELNNKINNIFIPFTNITITYLK